MTYEKIQHLYIKKIIDKFVVPITLSLSDAFSSFTLRTSQQATNESRSRIMAATSPVILVMAQGQRITTADFDSARRIMETTLLQFPDLYFVFVTNDAQSFTQLITGLDNLGTFIGDVSISIYLYVR